MEKNYFNENFRRVEFSKIGSIHDFDINIFEYCKKYENKIKELIDHKIIKSKNFRVAVDLMFGITKDIFPQLLTDVQIDNIMLNAYTDEKKLANIFNYQEKAKKDISSIVTSLRLNMGVMIYPHGQRLTLITEKGEVLDRVRALTAVLRLLNIDAKSKNKIYKVFLPVWAPDFMDKELTNMKISRGKYSNFTVKQLKNYDLIATIDGNFAFSKFTLHRDAMFSTLKIMELLTTHNITLSELAKEIKKFAYLKEKIECPQFKKGKVMKEFLKVAKTKKYSENGGIKIFEKNGWILMIPNEFGEYLDIYIQAKTQKDAKEIFEKYKTMIEKWIV